MAATNMSKLFYSYLRDYANLKGVSVSELCRRAVIQQYKDQTPIPIPSEDWMRKTKGERPHTLKYNLRDEHEILLWAEGEGILITELTRRGLWAQLQGEEFNPSKFERKYTSNGLSRERAIPFKLRKKKRFCRDCGKELKINYFFCDECFYRRNNLDETESSIIEVSPLDEHAVAEWSVQGVFAESLWG